MTQNELRLRVLGSHRQGTVTKSETGLNKKRKVIKSDKMKLYGIGTNKL